MLYVNYISIKLENNLNLENSNSRKLKKLNATPLYSSPKGNLSNIFLGFLPVKKNICNMIWMTQFCFSHKWGRMIVLQLILFHPITHLRESFHFSTKPSTFLFLEHSIHHILCSLRNLV